MAELESNVAISGRGIGLEPQMVVNEVVDKVLLSGFYGNLDSARMKSVIESVMNAIITYEGKVLIIELSNVDIIDSAVAAHLIKVGHTATLLGVDVIYCGISPKVAQTMVSTGIMFSDYKILTNLKSAVDHALKLLGRRIIDIQTK